MSLGYSLPRVPYSHDEVANAIGILRVLFEHLVSTISPDMLPIITTLDDSQLSVVLRNNTEFFSAVSGLVDLLKRRRDTSDESLSKPIFQGAILVLEYVSFVPSLAAAPDPAAEDPASIDEKDIVNAWEAPLRGSAHFDLLAALREAHLVNNDVAHQDEHYSNTATVLQSSGTGKTRNAAEMSRFNLTVMVILRPARDRTGFPKADEDVRDYLVVPRDASVSQQTYQFKVRVFLRLLFLSLGTWLQHQPPPDAPAEYGEVQQHWRYLFRVTAWNQFLESNRADVFKQIVQTASKICATTPIDSDGAEALKATVDDFIRILKDAEPSGSWDNSHVPDIFKTVMSFEQLAGAVAETDLVCKAANIIDPERSHVRCPDFGLGSTDLLVLLCFDEAQALTESNLRYTIPGAVLPESASDDPISSPLRVKSAYDVILSVLNDVRSQVVGLFLSTSAKIGQFAPPPALAASARQTESRRLQAPITELPFDCYLDKPLEIAELNFDMLSTIPFMAKFGRALFGSFLVDVGSMREERGLQREKSLLRLICAKLVAWPNYMSYAETKANSPNADKAVLDVRLHIQYNPHKSSLQSVQADMVTDHLRVAYSAAEHRLTLESGYSSEPIISEAAALIMYRWMPSVTLQDARQRAEYWNPLQTLLDMMNTNLIAVGERGELVARLLLTLAYDRAVQLADPKRHARLAEQSFRFSAGCTFVQFIEALFGTANAASLLLSTPDNSQSSTKLSDAFATARIRFTHFVRLGDESGLTTTALCAAFIRGMAFIGKLGQKRVDLIIPMLCDPAGPISPGNITALLIQVKLRKEPCSAKETDYYAEELHIFDDSDSGDDPVSREQRRARPYCTLLMELGAHMPVRYKKMQAAPPSPPSPPLPDTSIPSTPHRSQAAAPTAKDTPSGIHLPEAAVRVSKRLPPPPEKHPRYNIKAYGCSHTVYGGVIDADDNSGWGKAKYNQLLARTTNFSEHPRPSLISLVWGMKPLWVSNALYNSYHWFNAKVAAEPEPSNDESGHGVKAMEFVTD